MPLKAEHLETYHILEVSVQCRQVCCIVRCSVNRQAVILRDMKTVADSVLLAGYANLTTIFGCSPDCSAHHHPMRCSVHRDLLFCSPSLHLCIWITTTSSHTYNFELSTSGGQCYIYHSAASADNPGKCQLIRQMLLRSVNVCWKCDSDHVLLSGKAGQNCSSWTYKQAQSCSQSKQRNAATYLAALRCSLTAANLNSRWLH